jgi:hypothetical protein
MSTSPVGTAAAGLVAFCREPPVRFELFSGPPHLTCTTTYCISYLDTHQMLGVPHANLGDCYD